MPADDVMVDGTDLFDYEWELMSIPPIREFTRRYHTGQPLLGAPVRLDYAPIYMPRRFTLSGHLTADGTDELQERIETIQNLWAGSTEKTLEFPQMADGYFLSTLEGMRARRLPGRDYNKASGTKAKCYLDIMILCADPFRYIDRSDVTSSSGTAQDIDLGTAPTRRWTVEFTVAANTVGAGFRIENTDGDDVFTFQLDRTPTSSSDIELDMYTGSVGGDFDFEDIANSNTTFPIVLDPLWLGDTPKIYGRRVSGGSVPSVTASVSAAFLG